MNGSLTAQAGALARRAFSNVVPKWVQALLFGRPLARRLSFGNIPSVTRHAWNIIVPSAWAQRGVVLPPASGRRLVDVDLPQTSVLRREVRLPPTPSRTLRNAVLLDMMHKTPFRPDQTCSVLSDFQTSSEGVSVTQWVARRDDLEELRSRLRAAGFVVCRLRIADVASEPLEDVSQQAFPMGRVWRSVNAVALAVIVGVGLWTWAQPVLSVREARITQEAERDRLIEQAIDLRDQIEHLRAAGSERTAFLDRMTQRVPVIEILRAATEMLPDDVWLTDLAFERSRVSLRGSTQGSAAQMLLDLPKTPVLLNPQLAGPVSQTSDGRTRFDLVFQAPQGIAR